MNCEHNWKISNVFLKTPGGLSPYSGSHVSFRSCQNCDAAAQEFVAHNLVDGIEFSKIVNIGLSLIDAALDLENTGDDTLTATLTGWVPITPERYSALYDAKLDAEKELELKKSTAISKSIESAIALLKKENILPQNFTYLAPIHPINPVQPLDESEVIPPLVTDYV